jgi:hypothetical protein
MLRLAIGKAHRRYTRRINFRKDLRGHLWQERFSSFEMDEPHFLLCLRYVENNPVRVKLVKQPQQRPWSSASAHIKAKNDILVNVCPLRFQLFKITGRIFCRKRYLLSKWKPFASMSGRDGPLAVILLFKCWNKNSIEF